MILTHYGGSFVKGLMQVFPDIGLQPHRFATMASMSPLSPSFSLPSLSPSLFLSLPSLCPQTRSYLQVLTVSFISISLIYPPSPVCLLPPSPSLPLPLLSPSLPLFFSDLPIREFLAKCREQKRVPGNDSKDAVRSGPVEPRTLVSLGEGPVRCCEGKREKEEEGGRRREKEGTESDEWDVERKRRRGKVQGERGEMVLTFSSQGVGSLLAYHQGDLIRALQDLFPDLSLETSKFYHVPSKLPLSPLPPLSLLPPIPLLPPLDFFYSHIFVFFSFLVFQISSGTTQPIAGNSLLILQRTTSLILWCPATGIMFQKTASWLRRY